MTYHNAVKYISSAPRETEEKHSHDRLYYLSELMGGLHKRLNYIHLAGSNGKTICSALLSSVLSRSGYSVCFYYFIAIIFLIERSAAARVASSITTSGDSSRRQSRRFSSVTIFI